MQVAKEGHSGHRLMMEKDGKDDSRWSTASLVISGDSFEPDEISRELGLNPTTCGRKGEIRNASRVTKPRRNSIWILKCALDDHFPLQDHLRRLLDQLESKRETIGEISKRYKTELWCGYSSESGQGGCTFDAALIARVASMGVPLILDLYPPGPVDLNLDQQ
jgi:hypothetical protein